MRKIIALGLVEAALICAAIFLDLLTTIAPVWIWPTASVVCLVLAAFVCAPEIKGLFFKKGSTDQHLSKKLEIKLDRVLGYLRRICDVRLDGHTEFKAMEGTAQVGKRKAEKVEKKPTFLLTLRRCLGKLFP